MKKLLAVSALLLGFALQPASAQVRLSVNIGTPVANQSWYQRDNSYYYMPEQDVYYNVNRRVYVYQERNAWVTAPTLPSRYNGATWRRSHYVSVRERAPFSRHEYYQNQYRRNDRGSYNGRYNDNRRDYGRRRGGDNYRNDRRNDGRYDGRNDGRNDVRNESDRQVQPVNTGNEDHRGRDRR